LRPFGKPGLTAASIKRFGLIQTRFVAPQLPNFVSCRVYLSDGIVLTIR